MSIINQNSARTGFLGPYATDLQRDFWSDPAASDVIDAPKWIPTGSHECQELSAPRDGHIIMAETLRSLWVGDYY